MIAKTNKKHVIFALAHLSEPFLTPGYNVRMCVHVHHCLQCLQWTCVYVCVYDVIHEISATLTVFNVKFNFDYLILYFATKLTMFRLRTIGSVNSI